MLGEIIGHNTHLELSNIYWYTQGEKAINNSYVILTEVFFVCYFKVSPTIITKPINKTVTEGTMATLYCRATGNPAAKITWMKDGITVAKGDTLRFETNRNHSGKYWCLAENGLHPNVSASASLDVQCKY